MSFFLHYLHAFRDLLDYRGRATRTVFWSFVGMNYLVGFLIGFGEGWLHLSPPLKLVFIEQGPVSLLYMVVSLPAYAALGVRRLHDINRRGWWLLLSLIPVLGSLWLLWWFLQPSRDVNDFGWPASANIGIDRSGSR